MFKLFYTSCLHIDVYVCLYLFVVLIVKNYFEILKKIAIFGEILQTFIVYGRDVDLRLWYVYDLVIFKFVTL